MKIIGILFLSLVSLPAFTQRTIKGKVVNAATGIAVPGCSVFVSNTSRGTTSDNTGYFELNDVPGGKHDLVISSIGYETNVFSYSDVQLPLQLKVEMQIKVKELANVTVEPSVEEGWDKWGKTFSDNFIGTTDNGLQCRIRNTAALKFRFYKKSNRVVAYADEPLVIENKALGYTIHYQLEEFEVSYKNKTTFFLGYPLFEDKTKEGKEPRNKWQHRRDEAYKGSTMHFMQSIYLNKVKEEGFEVRRMTRTPNLEKERVKSLYRGGHVYRTNASKGTTTMEVVNGTGNLPADSTAYYERILRQGDYIDSYGPDIIGADSLIVKTDGDYKILYFENYLYITYKKELEEESYLRVTMQGRRPGFQNSFVFLQNGNPISIDKMGNYFAPQDFFTSGYWGWSEKISNLLPIEYQPGK